MSVSLFLFPRNRWARLLLYVLIVLWAIFGEWAFTKFLYRGASQVSVMQLSSPAFENGESIPAEFTCDDKNVRPPFNIIDVPSGTRSLVITIEDPDAPNGNWVHWLAWNIDPQTTSLGSGVLPIGTREGTTSFGKPGYGGPCPPAGTHHYHFRLYALDTMVELPVSATSAPLKTAMQNHILATSELIGLYSKK